MPHSPFGSKITLAYPWLPFAVTAVGIFFTLAIWYSLIKEVPLARFLESIEISFHWIMLVSGIFLAVLLGFAVRLIQLRWLNRISFNQLNKKFKKEIAERMHVEETKQKLEKALLQGQKLQAIGTLAGGIAHDFNNILYAVMGYVDMAREDVDKTSLVYQNLGKVLEAAKRGQELISRILTFSRRQHHDFIVIEIKETIEGVLDLLKPTIPASVRINFIPQITAAEISGNQTQLHQVIVNLINNAVDAMEGEGIVTIKLKRIAADDPILQELPHALKTNYCKITINDTGHGMDQAMMARIFEPFFTTKEVGKGTGLGLSTVHSIIEEHQGEILVASKLGVGTTFTLLIPEFIKGDTNGKNIIS